MVRSAYSVPNSRAYSIENLMSLMELNQSVQTQMEASQILHRRRQGYVNSLAERFENLKFYIE